MFQILLVKKTIELLFVAEEPHLHLAFLAKAYWRVVCIVRHL
jgi:hypothetical protein